MAWHKLALLAEITEGVPLEKEAKGVPLALFKVGGRVYCTANLCTHAEAFLSDGQLAGYQIECPVHGARFDIRDGRVLCPPAARDIASYPVRVEAGAIWVEL